MKMQLIASYPCKEDQIRPHIGKQIVAITTTNETIHGVLEQVRSGEIIIAQHTIIATTKSKSKRKAKIRRYPFPPHGHGRPFPGYPGFPLPPAYPVYPPPPLYPGYGGGSLVLPLFLLATLFARPY
jgi:hypothetical protein